MNLCEFASRFDILRRFVWRRLLRTHVILRLLRVVWGVWTAAPDTVSMNPRNPGNPGINSKNATSDGGLQFSSIPGLQHETRKKKYIYMNGISKNSRYPEIPENMTFGKTRHFKNSGVPSTLGKTWKPKTEGHVENSRVPENSRKSWHPEKNETFNKN